MWKEDMTAEISSQLRWAKSCLIKQQMLKHSGNVSHFVYTEGLTLCV